MQSDKETVQDNKEAIAIAIPSQGKQYYININEEEQVKILDQINKEENAVKWNAIQPKFQDEIYLEDNPQKALEKLLKLSSIQFNERIVYVRHLAELIGMIGEEGVQSLGPILEQILKDSDETKKSLILQMPALLQVLEGRSDFYDLLKKHIFGSLIFLLGYDNADVIVNDFKIHQIKEQAGQEISNMACLLNETDRGTIVLKKIITMAHDEQNEENKIVAAQLFGSLAAVLGTELIESFVCSEMLSMGEDARSRVRKEVVLQLASVCKVVTEHYFIQRILPFYQLKSEEKTWQVRKVAAEIIPNISRICPQKIRENELTKQMLGFLKDTNKWVKGGAYKALGPFIETFNKSKGINKQLLDEFCRANCKEVLECYSSPGEILQIISFNFPAVLATFGAEKWPQLSKLFTVLIKYNDITVRKPLACSFHELAHILGPQISERDLIAPLDSILKDIGIKFYCFNSNLDDNIKYGAVKNLWKFLQVFGESRKESLLDVFLILQKDQRKWRVRELIARQLNSLTDIFDGEIVFKFIVPITLKLCNDVVAQVRKQAAKQVYALIKSVENNPNEMTEIYKQCILENLKAFGCSTRFNQRQAFARMCQNLMNINEDLFQSCFMDPLTQLAKDPVRNVRITVAKVVAKHIISKGQLINNQRFLNIVKILQSDKLPEVSDKVKAYVQ